MNKLLSSVGLAIAIATASLLTGCQLYLNDRSNGDDPHTGSPGPGRPPGFQCNSDTQCAAGCFCADGVCAEAGFCAADKDCGTGFVCDVARASCKPVPACATDVDCPAGSACDPQAGSCAVTCKCTSDAEAVQQGAGWCDETRGTCMIGTDPAGACLGDVTCTDKIPLCAEGEVALVKDGCYTGECRAIGVCEGAPVCGSLQHETDCDARGGDAGDCSAVFLGHQCHGSTCGTSTVDCVCDFYTYAACEAKDTTTTTPRIVIEQ